MAGARARALPADAAPPATASRRRRLAPNHLVALGVALALTALGLVGWAVTGGMGWTEQDPSRTLLGLALNPLHNALHLAVGLAGLLLWRRAGGVRGYGLLLAVGYAAVVVYGLLATGRGWDVLNLNRADTALHLAAVVLGLVVALWPRPVRRPLGRRRPEGTDPANGAEQA